MPIEELFASVLDVPAEQLSDQTSPATLKNWNSLGHLQLIAAMEEMYDVTFSSAEIHAIKSLGIARGVLQQKGVAL